MIVDAPGCSGGCSPPPGIPRPAAAGPVPARFGGPVPGRLPQVRSFAPGDSPPRPPSLRHCFFTSSISAKGDCQGAAQGGLEQVLLGAVPVHGLAQDGAEVFRILPAAGLLLVEGILHRPFQLVDGDDAGVGGCSPPRFYFVAGLPGDVFAPTRDLVFQPQVGYHNSFISFQTACASRVISSTVEESATP